MRECWQRPRTLRCFRPGLPVSLRLGVLAQRLPLTRSSSGSSEQQQQRKFIHGKYLSSRGHSRGAERAGAGRGRQRRVSGGFGLRRQRRVTGRF
jgi:hypothetical protein